MDALAAPLDYKNLGKENTFRSHTAVAHLVHDLPSLSGTGRARVGARILHVLTSWVHLLHRHPVRCQCIRTIDRYLSPGVGEQRIHK